MTTVQTGHVAHGGAPEQPAVLGVQLRPGTPADANVCGRVCYEAFTSIAERHGFPPDVPSPEAGIAVWSSLVGNPGFYSVVAEHDGRIVGSNFLDERSRIAGVGPITVAPEAQDRGVGRRLMIDVMERAIRRGFVGVRLVQAAYHNHSLSLYTDIGFVACEPLVCLQGDAIGDAVPGYTERPATADDLDTCAQVCRQVHGHDRALELHDALREGRGTVVQHGERIVGYTTGIGYFGHAVAETDEALVALIAAASSFSGAGFLLPASNGRVFRWCLAHGLRVVQIMNLMAMGLYNEPAGAYLPSVLY